MANGKHVRRHTSRVVAVLGVSAGILVLVLGGMAFAAYHYEQARSDTILPGVSVGGVDVGGMTRGEAVAAVRQAAAAPLGAPLQVSVAGKTWTVTPQELGQRAGVLKAVNRALALNRSMGTFDRFWHRIRQEPVQRAIPVKYAGAAGVDALITKVEKAVARPPTDAHMTTDGDKLIIVKPKDGQELDATTAPKSIRQALRTHASSVTLAVTTVAPKVTAENMGPTIVVRVDQNMLYLYEGFKISRTWHVATAMPPWVTPAGNWIMDRKAVNPTWYNPNPTGWASNAPLVVPGGPDNPMGTRALYITAPGLIRIHGTSPSERPSIGHYESHGCIRMLNEDVEQLYPLVPVGTHVLIVGHRPY
jgi:lipoprotein-anchoring transpeptidase ErfK/SrfK